MQELTQAQLEILDELTSSGKLYEVPSRCLDDYYWMLSSVSNQTKCCTNQVEMEISRNVSMDMKMNAKNLTDVSPNADNVVQLVHRQVAPLKPEGKWPGTRPILITNDQMRDHKLELLEPHLFRRWFSSHIVNYEFDPFVKDIWEEREIKFVKADSFSREIQGNPQSSMTTKHTSSSAIAWHFPVQGWSHNDRFCVRIPRFD